MSTLDDFTKLAFLFADYDKATGDPQRVTDVDDLEEQIDDLLERMGIGHDYDVITGEGGTGFVAIVIELPGGGELRLDLPPAHIDTDTYATSHGRLPEGWATWIFAADKDGDTTVWEHQGTFRQVCLLLDSSRTWTVRP